MNIIINFELTFEPIKSSPVKMKKKYINDKYAGRKGPCSNAQYVWKLNSNPVCGLFRDNWCLLVLWGIKVNVKKVLEKGS